MKVSTLIFIAAILAACTSSNSGSIYSRDDARKVQIVKTGVVESVRAVKLEGTKSPVGTVAGGVVGGVAGGSIGHGRGSAIGVVVGAVVGSIAGSAIEEGVTRKDALEITVKLDSGTMIAIVQESDAQFHLGEKYAL